MFDESSGTCEDSPEGALCCGLSASSVPPLENWWKLPENWTRSANSTNVAFAECPEETDDLCVGYEENACNTLPADHVPLLGFPAQSLDDALRLEWQTRWNSSHPLQLRVHDP